MSRKLRPEEVELWRKVADRTQRLDQGLKPIDFDTAMKNGTTVHFGTKTT